MKKPSAGNFGKGDEVGLPPENVDMNQGQLPCVRLRSSFTITSHRAAGGQEQHLITAPKHGPDRAQARRAIMQVLHHADQHHHRVSFHITLGDYTQHSISVEHGYQADFVLIHCQMQENDPYAWLQRQIPTTAALTDANAIIGVSITIWP